MSPSSPPAVMLNVIEPDVRPPPTTAVWADVADVEPAEFVAVTTTRIVEPTSAETSAYVVAVAPPMSAQLAPPESQRRHWYEYALGAVPVQVPWEAVSGE